MNLSDLIRTGQCHVTAGFESTRLGYDRGGFYVAHNAPHQQTRIVIETPDEAEAVAAFCEAAGIEVEKETAKGE